MMIPLCSPDVVISSFCLIRLCFQDSVGAAAKGGGGCQRVAEKQGPNRAAVGPPTWQPTRPHSLLHLPEQPAQPGREHTAECRVRITNDFDGLLCYLFISLLISFLSPPHPLSSSSPPLPSLHLLCSPLLLLLIPSPPHLLLLIPSPPLLDFS